jgi:hypothetical protein
MKGYRVLFCVVLAGVFAFLGCSTTPKPRQLDVSTIKNENIPIYSISVLVTKKGDEGGMGKAYAQKICTTYINEIKKILQDKGITINVDAFVKEYNESQEIVSDEINVASSSYKMNRHYWVSRNKPGLRVELTLTLVTLGSESMPLTYTIYKDDPDYIPGYKEEASVIVKLGVKP